MKRHLNYWRELPGKGFTDVFVLLEKSSSLRLLIGDVVVIISNLIFICFQMLSEIIIHDCMVRLLRSSSDEESIECFCRLIITTGKEMDHKKAKVHIDVYIMYYLMLVQSALRDLWHETTKSHKAQRTTLSGLKYLPLVLDLDSLNFKSHVIAASLNHQSLPVIAHTCPVVSQSVFLTTREVMIGSLS